MMVTNVNAVQAFVYQHTGQPTFDPNAVYSSLKTLVKTSSKPLPAQRYVDPPYIKDLCRRRSCCHNSGERQAYSLQIFRLRAVARREWHQSLVVAAAKGHWASRRLLHRRVPLPVATRPLLDKYHGDPTDAAAAVREHFATKFSGDGDFVPKDFLSDLPDMESPLQPAEVSAAIASLQSNKTTGISRISVSLLKVLVQAEFGLMLLTSLLNAFLTNLETLPDDLAAGWVILLPKKALVDRPDQFRPIVCGEVVLKVLAKLAMTRIVSTWPLPTCCFGACRGRGVLEALYTVKACAQEGAAMRLSKQHVLIQDLLCHPQETVNKNPSWESDVRPKLWPSCEDSGEAVKQRQPWRRFGFDFTLDEDLHVWLIEVNHKPGMTLGEVSELLPVGVSGWKTVRVVSSLKQLIRLEHWANYH
eukprot:Skav236347  [mRNA]  locus=scaffold918:93635:94882:- [translate_table: standard]